MRILFILSGNMPDSLVIKKSHGVLIKNAKHQGDFLIKMGYDLDYFYIKGKGAFGYIKEIPKIIHYVKQGKYDIIHAHYSFSAFAASFIGRKRLVVSLMGSDIYVNPIIFYLIRFLCKYYWKAVLVKTSEMKSRIKVQKLIILPNGVDLELFKPMDKTASRKYLDLPEGTIILFAANPSRPEKNYKLAQEAVSILNYKDAILLPVFNVNHHEMPYYMNASDVLLLTSLWEGSVNVVKEAMACNLSVVSTDVGDVRFNTNNLPGYYITSFDPYEIARVLRNALDSRVKINGVERIKEMRLDALSVSNSLIDIYKSI